MGLRIHIKSSVFAITSASLVKVDAWKTLESLLVVKLYGAGGKGGRNKNAFACGKKLNGHEATKAQSFIPSEH